MANNTDLTLKQLRQNLYFKLLRGEIYKHPGDVQWSSTSKDDDIWDNLCTNQSCKTCVLSFIEKCPSYCIDYLLSLEDDDI